MRHPGPRPAWQRGLLSDRVSRPVYFVRELAAPARGWSLALGGREQCNADYLVERQGYAYHVLEYVAAGAGTAELNGRLVPLAPGTVIAYAPDTRLVLRADPVRPMLKYFFCLGGPAAGARLAEAGLAPGSTRLLPAHAEIRGVAEELLRDGQRASPQAPAICRAQFELLLLRVADLAAASAAGDRQGREAFLRAKAVLEAHIEAPARLADAARAAGMDVSTICRLFRRFEGTSPYQFLLRRKMHVAAEYLLETGGQVKSAAQRVGFADPYHFSRCFRAVHGVPPSQLRPRPGARTAE